MLSLFYQKHPVWYSVTHWYINMFLLYCGISCKVLTAKEFPPLVVANINVTVTRRSKITELSEENTLGTIYTLIEAVSYVGILPVSPLE